MKKIGNSVFQYCSKLTTATLPEGLESIERELFRECTELVSVPIPASVKEIGRSAFEGCSKLATLTIPNSVKAIRMDAFCGCNNLTAVVIPNSVWTMEDGAFSRCTSLTDLTIGSSLSTLPYMAFYGCSALTDVYCLAERVPLAYTMAFDGCDIEYATLHVPAGSIDAYKEVSPWKDFMNIVALESDGLAQMSACPVLIRVRDGVIHVAGAEDGQLISVYAIDGLMLGQCISRDGEASISVSLLHGNLAVVKIGDKIFKVMA